MSLAPLEVLTPLDDDDDDVNHLYCPTDPDVAFCGEDVSALPVIEWEYDESDQECEMCVVIWEFVEPYCPKCKKHIDEHY